MRAFWILSLWATLAHGLWFNEEDIASASAEGNGNIWAVLVAGSDGFFNYRHQADVCHAYQILKAHGVPDERIIVFMKDDIAFSPYNKNYTGQLINRPKGPDVYHGVPHDYTGDHYTLDNFFKVLKGEATSNGGKTLKSGPNDRVFINYADHGATGISGFGDGPYLKATLLNKAIQDMHAEKRFKQMLIYWESCESGSMFANLLPRDINVLASTAANTTESSWACYPDHDPKLQGVYLGDVFSVRWMEDSDRAGDLSKEQIKNQLVKVKQETKTSHVQAYGDLSIGEQSLSDFMGSKPQTPMHFPMKPCEVQTAQQDVPMMTLLSWAKSANSMDDSLKYLRAARELQKERDFMLKTTMDILKPFPKHWITTDHLYTNEINPDQMENCYYPLVDAFDATCYKVGCNNYALRMVRYFTDLCINNVNVDEVISIMKNVCDKETHDNTCDVE